MPVPLARGAVTMTGPSTGRLSMPVSLTGFHGFGRGRPTLTERILMPPLHLVAELIGMLGVVGAEHAGQPRRGPFGKEILLETRAQEDRQGRPEQRRAQVVQLGQAERVRGVLPRLSLPAREP